MIITPNNTRIYYEIYNAPKVRFIVNEGGTRSSKTRSAVAHFLDLSIRYPNQGIIRQVFRKTLASCRRTVMRDLIDTISEWDVGHLVNARKTDSMFEICGNYIEFCGADNEQKLRGAKRRDLFINEANELNADEFLQLNMRTENQILIDYNPSFTESWIYDRIEVETGLTNDRVTEILATHNVIKSPKLKLIKSTYLDNPFLPKMIVDEIENLKKFDENDYNIYALGIRSEASGLMFKRVFHQEYNILPEKRIGVIYVDPNLALKGKGDTTAITKLYYSATTGLFYIDDVICRSFSNPNELLNTMYSMLSDDCRYIAFDGNFSQETNWTYFVENNARTKGIRMPIIDYKRYRVDEISKLTQYLWNDRQILFNSRIKDTEDGRRYMNQVYQFNGKKFTEKGVHDDAPDSMICAINYMHELGFVVSSEAKNLINSFINKRA